MSSKGYKEYQQKWREDNKDYHKEWGRKNKDKVKAINKRYYEKNKDELNRKRCELSKIEYASNPLEKKIKETKRRDEAKLKVMIHYSKKDVPECVECGFDNIDALCIDHIKDNGGDDRRKIMGKNVNGGGSRFYFYLVRHGFPKGYQTLCANCNLIKEIKRKRLIRGY